MAIGVFTIVRRRTAPRGWRNLFALFLLTLSLLGGSCRHPDDPPPPPPDPEPGKRDYIWTYDTLNHPESFQTDMEDIWASSPHDVYVVGHNDRGPVGCMYRYDGGQWTSVKLHVSVGGTINAGFELHAVYGFDSTNIWAVGYKLRSNPNPPPNFLDSTFIMHYDGSAWRETPMERRYGELLTIWGSSPNDIWAGGTCGNLYHFSGGRWQNTLPPDSSLNIMSINGFSPGDLYMTTAKSLTGPDTIGLYNVRLHHWNGTDWAVVDSFANNSGVYKFGRYLFATDGHRLFSSLYGVYQFQREREWTTLVLSEKPLRIQGGSSKNMFACGDYWRLLHWNGTDWLKIETPYTDIGIFTGSWTDNTECFIIGHNGRVTYIMHGR